MYQPKQGDIVYVNFSPQSGHEQRGRRPALVVSNDVFNGKTGFVLVCPITSRNKKFPLHIPLPKEIGTRGVVLAEQVRSLDPEARRIEFKESAPSELARHVCAILESFYH